MCFFDFALTESFLILLQLREVFGSVRHAAHAVFRKISKVHNNGKTLLFIEPSECRMGGEALQLLRVLRLKDTIVEATMSKVLWKKRSFTSSGKLYNMKAFGTYSLQSASVGIHCFVF